MTLSFTGNLDSNLNKNCWIGDPIPYYQPIVEKHYIQTPIYTHYNLPEKSKLEQAFKIAKILIDKKLVSISKVKDFIDLVNDIVEVL